MATRNRRKYPQAVQDEAIRLFRLGFVNRDISQKMSIPEGTIVRWFTLCPYTRGDLLNETLEKARKTSKQALLPDKDQSDTAEHTHKMITHAAELIEGGDRKATASFAEKYRSLTLERLVKHMDSSLQAPPKVKTVAELQRLDQLIQNISGMSKDRHGGVGGKLHIDVNILSRPPKQKPIDLK